MSTELPLNFQTVVEPLHEAILTADVDRLPWGEIVIRPVYGLLCVFHLLWLRQQTTETQEFWNEKFLGLAVERDTLNPIVYLVDPVYVLAVYQDDKNKFSRMVTPIFVSTTGRENEQNGNYIENRLHDDIMEREIKPRGEQAIALFSAMGVHNLNSIEKIRAYLTHHAELNCSAVEDMITANFEAIAY